MTERNESLFLKAAIIVAVALIVSVFLYRYMSPYNTCVREFRASSQGNAEIICAQALNAGLDR